MIAKSVPAESKVDNSTRSTDPPLLELSKLYKIYGSGETEVRALDGVDLRIHDGQFVAVMGPSGSGKSTAMNVIGCLDVPTQGSYSFRGVDVSSLDRDQRALLRRHYIGFVFQGFNLLPRLSALENVELPLIYRGTSPSERRRAADMALANVGLTGRGHHLPAELSGGQQQRVAIARALVSNPAVLLADEPTGNLDTKKSKELMALLSTMNAELGITIVMVTHDAEMAEYALRLVLFRDGRIESDQQQPGIKC